MRILYLTPYLPIPNLHGGGTRMFSFIEALSRAHEIHLYTFVTPAMEPFQAEAMERLTALCRRVEIIPLTPSASRDKWWLPEDVAQFDHPGMRSAIAAACAEGEFDAAHVEYLVMAPYITGVRAKVSVLSLHEPGAVARFRKGRFARRPREKLFHWAEAGRHVIFGHQWLKHYDHIVTLTPLDRNLVRALHPGAQISLLPLGIDPDAIPVIDAGEPEHDLLFVGFFDHEPNADAVLHFCRAILPRIRVYRPVTFTAVGAYPPPALRVLASQDASIRAPGRVPDVRPYLASHTLFIAPIRLGGGMRMKILEALGAGMPIVATSIAAQGIEVGDPPALRIADSDSAFARAVIELLDDPIERTRMGMAGRALVQEKYNSRRIATAYSRLLHRLRYGEEPATEPEMGFEGGLPAPPYV